MLRATSGSNAHKGAIWVLGLLVCAASLSEGSDPEFVAEAAGYLARLPDRARSQAVSHGDVVLERYGATGARGEAYANFPHVVKIGLPALKATRKSGRTERDSRLAALLAIMSHLDDTCVLYRGGSEAQRIVHEGAARVIKVGGPGSPKGNAALIALGQDLVSQRISPGGSADLLAATLFLDALERGLEGLEKDNSLIEFNYPEAKRLITKRAHVGVVGSGDMEVLLEPNLEEGACVFITTSVNGFGDTWKAVFDRFFSKFNGAVRIHINDAGATPGSVLLRLEQSVEVIEQ
jgi:malonate decarboxylase acyl carrier protein